MVSTTGCSATRPFTGSTQLIRRGTSSDQGVTSFALAANGSMLYELFAGESRCTSTPRRQHLDPPGHERHLVRPGGRRLHALRAVCRRVALQVRHSGKHLDPPRPGRDLVRPGGRRLHALRAVCRRVALQYATAANTWTRLDQGVTSFALAADGSMLYELFAGGSLYKYATAANTWTRLDTNVTSFALAANGSMLYELFAGGSLYKYATAANTWTRLDTNVTSFALAADGFHCSTSCLPAGRSTSTPRRQTPGPASTRA